MDLRPAYVDCVAVLVKTGNGASIRISVLNRHPTVDWTTECLFKGFGELKLDYVS